MKCPAMQNTTIIKAVICFHISADVSKRFYMKVVCILHGYIGLQAIT
jgi:hypothetical protein